MDLRRVKSFKPTILARKPKKMSFTIKELLSERKDTLYFRRLSLQMHYQILKAQLIMSNPHLASSFIDLNWNHLTAHLPLGAPPTYPGYDYHHPYLSNGMILPPPPVSPLMVDGSPSSFPGSLGPTPPPPMDFGSLYPHHTGGIPSHYAQIYLQSHPSHSGLALGPDPFAPKPTGSVILHPRIHEYEDLIKKEDTTVTNNNNNNPVRARRSSLADIGRHELSDVGDSPPRVYRSHKAGKMHHCAQEGCDYKTDRKNNLFRHARTMHGFLENGRLQPCCGITFHTKTQYRQHIRASHSEGYRCSWQGCPKLFPRKALLMRHFKIHTGEKAFFCTESDCAYTTNHKSNLDRHVNTHQKRQLGSPSPLEMDYDDVPLVSPKVEAPLAMDRSFDSGTTIRHLSITLPNSLNGRSEDDQTPRDQSTHSQPAEQVQVRLSFPKLSTLNTKSDLMTLPDVQAHGSLPM